MCRWMHRCACTHRHAQRKCGETLKVQLHTLKDVIVSSVALQTTKLCSLLAQKWPSLFSVTAPAAVVMIRLSLLEVANHGFDQHRQCLSHITTWKNLEVWDLDILEARYLSVASNILIMKSSSKHGKPEDWNEVGMAINIKSYACVKYLS
jgi:hypothetical protein